ncbi:hypothetical protein PHMEG_00034437 [Phytophthora megakarya]|uniref:Uncharacterized protein n=1 Tax=Phytophthora megakarya TaxID=4795 RepID=A0A225UR11_9STRA|nr:hypothetical protein PHMEG_00034437 [Phytophthora megakarya]
MDRGGWSMSSVSKAFNYIVSTTHEGQKVAKTLAGWRHDDDPHLPTLRAFDPSWFRGLGSFKSASSRLALETWALTIRTDIIHQKEQKRCSSPTISTHNSGDVATQQAELIERQTRVIESLAQQVRSLNQRVLALEDPRVKAPSSMRDDNRTESNSAAIGVCKPASDRRSGAKAPSSVWYELFSDLKGQKKKDRRRYHEAKLAVAYMRIFLPRGYDVSASGRDTKSRILKTGLEAESNLIDFLNGQRIKARR